MSESDTVAKGCTTQHLPAGGPSNEWTPQELHAYAQSQHQAILDDERKLAVKYWRMGQALNLLRKHFNHGQWERLLGQLSIEKSKASRARAIARSFEKEEDVAGMTVKQAYEQRTRKQRKPLVDAEVRGEQYATFARFLAGVMKNADSFVDYAGFAEQSEAAGLLPAVDGAIAGLEQVRNLLRQQAESDVNRTPSPSRQTN